MQNSAMLKCEVKNFELFVKSKEIATLNIADWVKSITSPYNVRGIITANSDFNIDSHIYMNLMNDVITNPYIVVRSFLNYDATVRVRVYLHYV